MAKPVQIQRIPLVVRIRETQYESYSKVRIVHCTPCASMRIEPGTNHSYSIRTKLHCESYLIRIALVHANQTKLRCEPFIPNTNRTGPSVTDTNRTSPCKLDTNRTPSYAPFVLMRIVLMRIVLKALANFHHAHQVRIVLLHSHCYIRIIPSTNHIFRDSDSQLHLQDIVL